MSPEIMPLAEALRERRSVRGFTDRPVPDAVLEDVFSLAQLSPSNCNVQPWRVFVASGNVRDELRRRMVEKAASGVAVEPDFESGAYKFDGVHRQRQVSCAVELYNNMGIARDDKAGRQRAALRNFELFDAPHVAFIGMDRRFGIAVALDVGIYMQSLMLAMTAHGIACCPQGSMRYYPNDVREVFAEPDSTMIVSGISFGYENPTVAANRTRVGRVPLEDSVIFKAAW